MTKRRVGQALTGSNISHVGFVVADLNEAMSRVSQALQLTFLPILDQALVNLEEAERHGPSRLRLTWSIEGPPHVELIEAHESGVYSMHATEGEFHHLGGFADKNFSALSRFDSLGVGTDAVQRDTDGAIIATYSDPDGLFGIRFEHIALSQQESIAAWLSGQPWA